MTGYVSSAVNRSARRLSPPPVSSDALSYAFSMHFGFEAERCAEIFIDGLVNCLRSATRDKVGIEKPKDQALLIYLLLTSSGSSFFANKYASPFLTNPKIEFRTEQREEIGERPRETTKIQLSSIVEMSHYVSVPRSRQI